MSELKATPGPWEAKRWGSRYYRIVEAHQGLSLARTTPDWPLQIEIANARLIAAAPELYEALIGLLPIVFTGSPTSEQNIAHWERERDLGNGEAPAVLAAYAVLAKARGETA